MESQPPNDINQEARAAWAKVNECEGATDANAPMRLAAALEEYAEQLDNIAGKHLDAASARARAKNVRKEFYRLQEASDTTPEWQIKLALKEAKKGGDQSGKSLADVCLTPGAMGQTIKEIPPELVDNDLFLQSITKPKKKRPRGLSLILLGLVMTALAIGTMVASPASRGVVGVPLLVLAVVMFGLGLKERSR